MAKKEKKMQNIIKQINKDLDKLDLFKVNQSFENEKLNDSFNLEKKIDKDKDNSFMSFNSENNDIKSINSNVSHISSMTYVSEPFNEEKDLDLPNFTPTKYYKLCWKLSHNITYFLFGFFLLISSIFIFSDKHKKHSDYNIIMLISHIFYFISTIIEWHYFKRGCIGPANLNSKIKKNIDKSFKAKLLRMEEGFKYFFSVIAAFVLIYGNIYFICFCKKMEPECWNINFFGNVIISLTQILKLEKILTKNKQYFVVNDLSNSLIEIFLFFCSLSFGTLYFLQIAYNYDLERFQYVFMALKLGGSLFIIISGLCLFHRYFFSNYADLNVSSISNVSI